jgi:hypothetical protein
MMSLLHDQEFDAVELDPVPDHLPNSTRRRPRDRWDELPGLVAAPTYRSDLALRRLFLGWTGDDAAG